MAYLPYMIRAGEYIMTNEFTLIASKRTTTGTKVARRLRRLEDTIPAIIYGGDKEPETINLLHNDVLKAIKKEAFFSHILTLDINDKKEKVVIKDMQRHPYKNKVVHMDFQRVKAGEAITMNVPLHFTGEEECPGVKDGGSISHLMNEVEVKCLPKDLPEFINVDVSKVELDGSIHLKELVLPKGVEITMLVHDDEQHNLAVVSVHKLKAQPIEEEAPADAAEDTETQASEQDAKEGE